VKKSFLFEREGTTRKFCPHKGKGKEREKVKEVNAPESTSSKKRGSRRKQDQIYDEFPEDVILKKEGPNRVHVARASKKEDRKGKRRLGAKGEVPERSQDHDLLCGDILLGLL